MGKCALMPFGPKFGQEEVIFNFLNKSNNKALTDEYAYAILIKRSQVSKQYRGVEQSGSSSGS